MFGKYKLSCREQRGSDTKMNVYNDNTTECKLLFDRYRISSHKVLID